MKGYSRIQVERGFCALMVAVLKFCAAAWAESGFRWSSSGCCAMSEWVLKVGQMRARAMLVPATMQQHEHESQPSMDICHSPVQLFTMLKSCHKSYALLSGRQC